jgi:hypothetical protein
MTLEETITYCLVRANDKRFCVEDQVRYAKIAAWLLELQMLKTNNK